MSLTLRPVNDVEPSLVVLLQYPFVRGPRALDVQMGTADRVDAILFELLIDDALLGEASAPLRQRVVIARPTSEQQRHFVSGARQRKRERRVSGTDSPVSARSDHLIGHA